MHNVEWRLWLRINTSLPDIASLLICASPCSWLYGDSQVLLVSFVAFASLSMDCAGFVATMATLWEV
ncbi:uncharacterized protein ARMOST_02115 [Armillaria ostoyae]|uniref:Uncharacterized protein n=1 Tax=Armillaria ostoyae TaxID=47428 RepID=A0A284QQW6_ARMOS|nr:uncharacterized protein ARMOST_02115 [Armillaria ostoyae]